MNTKILTRNANEHEMRKNAKHVPLEVLPELVDGSLSMATYVGIESLSQLSPLPVLTELVECSLSRAASRGQPVEGSEKNTKYFP